MKTISRQKCFGGWMGYYSHQAPSTRCSMKFAVYEPPRAASQAVPMLTWLAGLTCTEETFMIKAGAQRWAAELGLMLVAPDTSPRGEGVPEDPEGGWDLGLGAGFYLNATQPPFDIHYHMDAYVTRDLQAVVHKHFNVDCARQGIFGHSMGGHGALTLGLKYPDLYRSISAFAPIGSTMACPWGRKALSTYLGTDRSTWEQHDAAWLLSRCREAGEHPKILVDQGLSDPFLADQLHPHLLEQAARDSGYPLKLRRHEGYDHSYYFIASFIDEHLRHHAQILQSLQT